MQRTRQRNLEREMAMDMRREVEEDLTRRCGHRRGCATRALHTWGGATCGRDSRMDQVTG